MYSMYSNCSYVATTMYVCTTACLRCAVVCMHHAGPAGVAPGIVLLATGRRAVVFTTLL